MASLRVCSHYDAVPPLVLWQIYGLRLQRFAEGLEQDHPSLDGSLAAKRRRMETAPDGSSGVAAEVNELNARYLALAEDLAKALDQQVSCFPLVILYC